MKDRPAPDGFLRFSDAVTQLAEGMWGGLRQSEPVRTIKKEAKKASIGFGPWQEQAGKRLTAAVRKGEIAVYVVADRQRSLGHLVSPQDVMGKPEILPNSVLIRLMTSRGTLSDYPIRPSIKTTDGDHKLFELLTVGILLVHANDFADWYRSERAKGKWPSQRSRSKIGNGRPTKQTDAMRNAVIALVHDQKWTGEVGITKLHRILVDSGRTDVPSPDTLTRLVDQLHHETGDLALFRKKPARRKHRQKAASK
jgi:hypothetical protein